jgi:hypothetical protein
MPKPQNNLAPARKMLVPIVKRLARHADVKSKLAEGRKRREKLDHPDFVWHELLGSFATMGSSAGAKGLIHNKANYRRVKFEALKRKGTKSARLAELRKVLRKAGVRWPEKKSVWLAENFDLVAKLGGPKKARSLLLGCEGREAMIEFWRQFKGMRKGEKYPRNIMMDCYHPDFRDCIAVDARIKGISRALGLSFETYSEEENFYLEVAKKARLEGWALDRIMYGFRDCILEAIEDAEDLAAIRSRSTEKTIAWEEVKRRLRL